MAAFPTVRVPSTFEETKVKKQILSESDGGYIVSRALGTVSKMQFKWGWPALTHAEKKLIDEFFDANLGTTFTYTHPDPDLESSEQSAYTLRFLEDSLKWKWSNGFWSLTLLVGEV